MACDQTGRICYGIELDEKFVDVIVKRFIEGKGSADEVFLLRNGEKLTYDKVPKPIEKQEKMT